MLRFTVRRLLHSISSHSRIALGALLTAGCLVPIGCGFGADAGPATNIAGGEFKGNVFGGQQPVVGATVQLWAAGETGYGSAATVLASATTDATGSFSFAAGSGNTYTCPNSNSLIYLTALGGQPTPGVTNSKAAFMIALGNCANVKSNNPYIWLNELTTIASMFAMQQFFTPNSGSPLGSFSTSATNIAGLSNAMATVSNLVNTANGTSFNSKTVNLSFTSTPTFTNPQLIITPEQGKIDVLADILAACVNSTGSGSAPCNTLLSDVTPSSSITAQDTVQAAYYLATNPSGQQGTNNYLSTVFGLATPSSPFQPALSVAPSDWSIGIAYDSASISDDGNLNLLDNPQTVAVDSNSNIWVLNNADPDTLVYNSIVQLSPTGIPQQIALTNNFSGATGMIVDPSNNVWVANYGDPSNTLGNTVVEYTAGGATNTFNTGAGPSQLASDGAGNIFVVEPSSNGAANQLEEIPAGSANGATATTLSTTLVTGNSNIAVDSSFNLWITGGGTTTSCTGSTTGCAYVYQMAYLATPPHYATAMSGAAHVTAPELGLSIDHSNNVWVQNFGTDQVSYLSGATLAPLSGSPFTQSTNLNQAAIQVLDGAGNVWVADGSAYGSNPAGAVYGMTSSGTTLGSKTSGLTHTYGQLYGIAVDKSGNIWAGNANNGAEFLTEILGAAVPVVTPIAAGLPTTPGGTNTLASKP